MPNENEIERDHRRIGHLSEWQIAQKWLARAKETERHIAEYDPSDKELPEIHMMEVEIETLRQCASDLLSLNSRINSER